MGGQSSITIGSDGYPVIAYDDETNFHLKLAKCTDIACTAPTLSTLDSSGTVGGDMTIAIGRDGYPVIAYRDGTGQDLRFAKCNDANCSSPTLTTLDSTGDVGHDTSIAIGRDGYPVISYYDWDNEDLKLAKCNDAACTAPTITTLDSTGGVGTDSSLAIGRDGYPVVTYYDSDNTSLKLAKCNDIACTAPTLSTIDSGRQSSIAVGHDGYPVIAYRDTFAGLRFAKCNNINCSTPALTTLDASGSGAPSITIGRDGYPMVSYTDGDNSDLKFAKCNNPTCTAVTFLTLDSVGIVGYSPSITRGIDGYPVISYYDITNGDLKFLACGAYCGSGVTIGKSQASKVASGLVGYWSFNGPDFTDKVYDRSGNGNHGSVGGGAATSTVKKSGRVGQAIQLDGTNPAIDVGSPSSLDDLGPMSISAWIYPRSSGGGGVGHIVAKDAYFGGGSGGWAFYIWGTQLAFRKGTTDGNDLQAGTAGFLTNYDQWYHVAMTWNGTVPSGGIQFYVNGSATTTVDINNLGTLISDASLRMYIGNEVDGISGFDGKIDEVRVYNRILTASEIKELYMLGR